MANLKYLLQIKNINCFWNWFTKGKLYRHRQNYKLLYLNKQSQSRCRFTLLSFRAQVCRHNCSHKFMVSDSEPTGLTRKYFQTVNIGWLKSKVMSSGWFMELVRETASDLLQMNKNNLHKCGYVLHGNIQMIRKQHSEVIFSPLCGQMQRRGKKCD